MRRQGSDALYSLHDDVVVLDGEIHDVLIVANAASGEGGGLNQQGHRSRVDAVGAQVAQEVVSCGQVLVQEPVCRTSSAAHRPLLYLAETPPLQQS